MKRKQNNIKVLIKGEFIPELSNTKDSLFYFSYKVNIHNCGQSKVQLLSRHWDIKDANGNEVNGGTITTDFGSDYQIQDSGEFELSLDLFKKGGGLAESKRLEIPLIGQIPISNDIVSATDNGEPLIRLNPEHKASKIYISIVDKMVSILDET